jgi:hypothetical protein
MGKETVRRPLVRFLDFGKKVFLVTGIASGLSLAIWAVVSLLEGRRGSPAGALLLGALALFVLAMLPFFFDLVSTLMIPLRAWIQKRGARELLVADRPRSETGISLTFRFFSAGLVLMLLSFLAGRLFGG